MRYYNNYGFPHYVPVAEKQARAKRKLEELRKNHPGVRPVILGGRTLVQTWWGKAWNDNLNKYADYANRVGRGRSYLRHGAVLDLQIRPGRVEAIVQGSDTDPYTVSIKIKPLSKSCWKAIQTACAGQITSLPELLKGKFPKALAELFTAKGSGLFPSPKEIDFECSCPDWAVMCKHVAAVLYGIGTRMDEDSALLFLLRKVKMRDLVTEAVRGTSSALLKRAKTKSARVIDDADLGDVFGIELETNSSVKRANASVSTGEINTTTTPVVKKAKPKRTTKKTKAVAKKAKQSQSARMKK